MRRLFARRLDELSPSEHMLGSGSIEIESLNPYTSAGVFIGGVLVGGATAFYFREQVREHLAKTLKGMQTTFEGKK